MLHVDSREKPAIRDLVAFTAGPTHVMMLECADFLLFDACGHSAGLERKTWSDFLGSLSKKNAAGNKRMWDQLDRMKQTYDWRGLLLEGAFGFNVISKHVMAGGRGTGWHSGSVQMILAKIQAEGTTILPQSDKHMTADTLRVLHARALKGCVLPRAMQDEMEEQAA